MHGGVLRSKALQKEPSWASTGIGWKTFTVMVGIQDFGTEGDEFVELMKNVVKWKHELELLDHEDLDGSQQGVNKEITGGYPIQAQIGSSNSPMKTPGNPASSEGTSQQGVSQSNMGGSILRATTGSATSTTQSLADRDNTGSNVPGQGNQSPSAKDVPIVTSLPSEETPSERRSRRRESRREKLTLDQSPP